MIICDYVRVDGGMFHMIAAGIDRVRAPVLPAIQNVGVAVRLSLTRAECDHTHSIELVFQSTDGHRVAELRGAFRTEYPADAPPGWPAHAVLSFNMPLPLQDYGEYSFELLINGDSKKSIGVFVERPAVAHPGAG